MKSLMLMFLICLAFVFTGCSENFSDGFRVGYVQKFSKHGLIFKTYNGTLRVVSYAGQIASNTDDTWEFSLDRIQNKNENIPALVAKINEAMEKGYRVKIHYNQSNFYLFRGDTGYFVQSVEFLK